MHRNVSDHVLAYQGHEIQPGEVCPETCDTDWLAHFVHVGVLRKESDEETR